jgi:hypothetical protein
MKNRTDVLLLVVICLVLAMAACSPPVTAAPRTQTAEALAETQQAIREAEAALASQEAEEEAATAAAAGSATAQFATDASVADTQVYEFAAATETAAAEQTATEVARQAETQIARMETQQAATAAVTEAVQSTNVLRVEDIDPPRDCMDAEELEEYEAEDDLAAVEFSTVDGNMVVRAFYASQALETTMRANVLLYGLGVGVLDPAAAVPPEQPSNDFAAAANLYLQVQWFLQTGTLISTESVFDQGMWTSANLDNVIWQINETEVRVLIPLQYFPEEGYLFAGVIRDNRVCDYAGMDPNTPHQPYVHYVIIEGVGQFTEMTPPVVGP